MSEHFERRQHERVQKTFEVVVVSEYVFMAEEAVD